MKDRFLIYDVVNALQYPRPASSKAMIIEAYMDDVNRGRVSLQEFPTWARKEGRA